MKLTKSAYGDGLTMGLDIPDLMMEVDFDVEAEVEEEMLNGET